MILGFPRRRGCLLSFSFSGLLPLQFAGVLSSVSVRLLSVSAFFGEVRQKLPGLVDHLHVPGPIGLEGKLVGIQAPRAGHLAPFVFPCTPIVTPRPR